jgi:cytochrome c biogenesis protein CcmG/thiol:disulfide interchange protein DsbE
MAGRLKLGAQVLALTLVTGLFVLLVWKVTTQGDNAADELGRGKTPAAPHFRLDRLDRPGKVSLAAYRGKPVILNFWASWCEPCKRETPELVAFSKRHPKIAVVGLAVNDAASDARRFARKEGVPYALGLDRDADVADRFAVTGLPVTAVIDADGRLASTFIGEISEAQLESFATQLGG